MNAGTHRRLADFIWGICNLLRGVYKRNEYRKVILPLTVLRRFDCVLAATKQAVIDEHARSGGQIDTVKHQLLQNAARRPFYNTSKLDFRRLLDDPNELAANLVEYIEAFSENVREIMRRFGFETHIAQGPAAWERPLLRCGGRAPFIGSTIQANWRRSSSR